MKAHHITAIRKSLHFTSRILLLKGIVAGSVTALALFGVMVPILGPLFGVHPHATAVTGGVVATVGGILGAALAARA